MKRASIFAVAVISFASIMSCNKGLDLFTTVDRASEIEALIDDARDDAELSKVNWNEKSLTVLTINYNRVIQALASNHVGSPKIDDMQEKALSVTAGKLEEDVAAEPADLITDATYALFDGLDRYSQLLTPDEFKNFRNFGREKFTGIGIRVRDYNDGLLVVEVMRQSGITEDRLKRGDTVLGADDENFKGLSLREKVELVRGEPGSRVVLKIMPFGEKRVVSRPFMRKEIDLLPYSWEVREFDDDRIAIIRIDNFAKDIAHDVESILDGAGADGKEITALIVDLRGNPGGLLDEAAEMIDLFVDEGVAVTVVDNEDENRRATRARQAIPESVGMFLLVDDYSASASEVIAGTLQLRKRAVILGKPTFGKTSVQYYAPLAGGWGVKITAARYYPGDHEADREFVRVEPDIVGEDDPETVEDELLQTALELAAESG